MSDTKGTQNTPGKQPKPWSYEEALGYVSGYCDMIKQDELAPRNERDTARLWCEAKSTHEADALAFCLSVYLIHKYNNLINLSKFVKMSPEDLSYYNKNVYEWLSAATAFKDKVLK